MIRLLKRLHVYLGLILGPPLLVIVITVTILGFHDYPNPSQKSEDLPPSRSEQLSKSLLEIIQTHPDFRIEAIHLPQSSEDPWKIKLASLHSSSTQTVEIHPHSQALQPHVPGTEDVFMKWVLKIHRGTWADFSGKVMTSLVGFLSVLLWPSGWLLYSRRSKPKSKKVKVKTAFGYHRKFGYLFGGAFSAMVLLGSVINFQQNLLEASDPPPKTPLIQTNELQKQDPARFLSVLFQSIAQVQKARPDSRLRSIHFLNPHEAETLFYFTDNSRVYLNQETQQIEKVMSPTSHWIHALYPIHSGKIFGPWSLAFILGLGSLSIFIILTGLIAAFRADWIKSPKRSFSSAGSDARLIQ
jgi:uncharacterized iron-regulated membrane protein